MARLLRALSNSLTRRTVLGPSDHNTRRIRSSESVGGEVGEDTYELFRTNIYESIRKSKFCRTSCLGQRDAEGTS